MAKHLFKLAVLLGLTEAIAVAGPIPLGIGSGWTGQYEIMGASGEYFASQYVATQTEDVEISGYYENTDQYVVYVNGSAVLTTDAIPGPAIDYGDTYGTYTTPSDATYTSGLFSTGVFAVQANDVISIQDIGPLYPDLDAGGYDAQVALNAIAPEPGTMGLLFAAVIVGGFFLRRWLRISTAIS